MDEETFWEGLDDLRSRHPGVLLGIEDDDGHAFIAAIEAREPGRGEGTAFMRALCAFADRCGVTLSADPAESGGERLVAWYGRLGFRQDRWGRLVRDAGPSPAPSPR